MFRDSEFKFYIVSVNKYYNEEDLKKLDLNTYEFLKIILRTLNYKNNPYFNPIDSIFYDPST